jgi:NAD(P)-dependent dehydrogenase (short-subunit alcohol dehydrogenase family)
MEIAGKIAVVTGGGAGLGRLLAVGLAAAGAGVLVADIDEEAAAGTADLVRQRGVRGRPVGCDVRDPAEAHRLIRLAVEEGGPHILVNNAGGWSPGGQYPDAPADVWTATMQLNLLAPMLLSQLALAPMRDLGGGVVVNISSSGATGSSGYGSPEYGASKAGLIRFTSSLAGLEDSHHVRMTCVVPGWIGLDRAVAQMAALPADERAHARPLIPPDRVVEVVLELITGGRSGTVIEMPGGEQARTLDTPGF